MRLALTLSLLTCFLGTIAAAELRVVSLHPLIGDLLKQVGGDQVEVIDLIGATGDPHSFAPSVEKLAATADVKVYFVSGMGLENYLSNLRTILPSDVRIVEVGASLPALHGACDHEGHDHDHEGHELDPHWWHSVDLFRRAAGVVAEELSKEMPDARESFEANSAAYRAKLDALEKWVKREVIRIPKDRRKLATAHAAFQYFCDEYGFESFSVQGLNREQMPDAVTLAKLISTLKEEQVAAIFPERESNPKVLQSITRDTGIKLGVELIADGRGVTSYEDMVKANVTAIVSSLSTD